MSIPEVQITKEKHTCIVRFNRPQQKNAINEAMYTALSKGLQNADADPEIRVIVLCGGQNCFTAGNDLREFLASPPTGENSPGFQFLKSLTNLQKPLVAAVNGPAVGIGTTLLLHCDFIYAGESAVFILPFINLGLCPEAASSLLLPQTVGLRRATEMLMLGESIDAHTAQKIGIINAVCQDSETENIAMETAKKLAGKSLAALRHTKALLKSNSGITVEEMIYKEIQIFAELLHSPEAKAAMTAFLSRK
ncbi:MAG: enoyl-CoA hydratase [Calditrichaeota bacterium]|nr:MAG: enoyl-CoA hydratase [Calditrichota bacterium]